MSRYLRHFWHRYGDGILLLLAAVLLATVSFRVGQINETEKQAAKVDVSVVKRVQAGVVSENAKAIDAALKRKGLEQKATETLTAEQSNPAQAIECALIASKNSNKYHLPNCKNASRINVSNRICFGSEEEAVAKGYVQAKCCHK